MDQSFEVGSEDAAARASEDALFQSQTNSVTNQKKMATIASPSMACATAEEVFGSDMMAIRDRMGDRRRIMEEQVAAMDQQAKLCDQLRAEKRKLTGVAEAIAGFETANPALFQYIRRLENLSDGLWCATCDSRKNVGGKPAVAPATPAAPEVVQVRNTGVEMRVEMEKIQAEYMQVLTAINNMRKQADLAMEQLTAKYGKIFAAPSTPTATALAPSAPAPARIQPATFVPVDKDDFDVAFNAVFEQKMEAMKSEFIFGGDSDAD